jgi:DNA-binding NarL/FixJ family response regulator
MCCRAVIRWHIVSGKVLAESHGMRPHVKASPDGNGRHAAQRGDGDSRPLAYPPDLTTREREIAEAITQGLSNRAIADRFGVRERTVKNQLTVIYSKAHVSSRLELATLLLRDQSSR